MNHPRRTALVITLGTATALALPGAALADTAAPGTTYDSTPEDGSVKAGGPRYSPASPLDSLFAAPGDLYGTLSAELPD